MAVPQNTVNKQTCTPWNDVDPFPNHTVANGNDEDLFGSCEIPGVVEKDTQTDDGNLSPCGFSDTPEISFKFVVSTDDDPANVNMADVGTDSMAVSDGSGGRDDPLPETKDSKAIWGDAFGATPFESSDVLTEPSEPDQNCQTPGCNGTAPVDPFVQRGSTSSGGFSDNFCEMTETDLIFKSGLVDEEFKTICVTAEEDDLWSSFPQSEESTAWANHSVTHESWDPFPANQQPSEPFPAKRQQGEIGSNPGAMQSEPNLSTGDNSQTDHLLNIHHHQTEITSDVLTPKVQNPSQSTKHSNSAVLPLEGKTSVLSNQLSANGNVQSVFGVPGNIEASGSKPQDAWQMPKDATFRDSILEGPWMAEVDCLESKAFTVDLNKNPLSQDAGVKSSNMDLLSDQAVPDPSSQIDQNNLWRSNNEGISLPPPADVNANKEANGGILYGDTGAQDPKAVVAPPPEFDNSLDPQTDNAEPNGTLVFANSNQINGNVNIQFELEGNLDKGNDRGRTLSELDRFLNELGDGTVIDDEATGNGRGQSPNDKERIVSNLGDDAEKEDATIERGQSPSDVLRLLNDLGDGTAVDEEVRQIDGVQSPSDVLKFLNELGDGTIVDEEEKQIDNEGQTQNNVDQAPKDLEDVMTNDDCDKQSDRAETLGDGDHILNDSEDVVILDDQEKQINTPEAPSGVYHVPSEFGDSTTVDEQDKQTDTPEIQGDIDHVQNNLGEDTSFDEQDKQINTPEAPSGVYHVPSEFGDSTTVDEQDKQTDTPEIQGDIDHVQNNLGEDTSFDEQDKQINTPEAPSGVYHVPSEFGDSTTVDEQDKQTDTPEIQIDMDHVQNNLVEDTTFDEQDKQINTPEAPSGVYHVPSEFGDSTTVDEQDKQTDTPATQGDVDHVQNNLGDGTSSIDEQVKQINRPEAPSDVDHGPREFGDSSTVDDQDKQTDRPETESDVDHVQNILGDSTAVDEMAKQTDEGQPLIEVNQALKDFEEDTEPAVVKLTDRGRTQSEVERLLNELGDGTVVDEEDDSLMTSEKENEDNRDSLAGEEDQMLEKVGEASVPPEPSRQEEISALSTDEAWDEMVRESTVALQESVPDESSNLNGHLEGSDQIIDPQTTEAPQDIKEVAVERTTPGEKDTTEPEVSETNTKLDLNAKRRSFFGDEDVNITDASFQPTITDKPPPSSPISSMNLSLALPNVPVLPKVQMAYHRPESFYETKPRAATDSFLSSHALLGLGGDQAITTDTKSRSASEPPPSSITDDQPATSNGLTSPRSKDPSIEVKSTKFIRALYGPKPGSKASELVDEDGKTLFEYEQERRDVLSAMKVKRKKKVNWQHDDSQSEDLPTLETEDPVSKTNRKDIKSHTEPQPLNSKESLDISMESHMPQNTEPELCKSSENVVQSHIIISKENVTENKPQFAPVKISPVPQSTSSENATPVRSTKPPSKIEDTLIREEEAEKKKIPSIESTSPHVESQSDVSKATPTVAEQPKVSLSESQAEEREEETPADMKKIRSLWEQKASSETGKEAEKQMSRRPQPRRMFSLEAKAKIDEVKKTESQNDPQPITQEAVKVDTSDAMPRDVDDAFDHCESYTYEVNPERKVTIQSHRTTESVVEQEIRKQREREQEFHKQGLQRSSADQGAVFKEGTKLQLVKQDQDVTADKFEQQSSKLDERSPKIKSPSGTSKQPSLKTSPAALRQNLRATPVKWAESEIKQESVQAQESQPDSLSLGKTSEPVKIVKEKEETSKSDSDARQNEPQRRESIVQREIRLQKERDEQNAIERQKALEETRIRRASFDSSSQSSQGDSGRSTPVRIPQSPVKLSPTSTPIKPSSPPTGSSGFTPIKPALLPSGLKTADSSPSVTKPKDKSPVVKFGLGSMQTTQYSSYREYQRMLRGRKTSEKTSDKPGPMKATEGGGALKQSPASVVLKDSPAKEQAQQRPPSPLLRRSPSPVFNRPPSPSPYQPTSPVANPVDPALKDSSESKPETAVQREIRLAKEREAQLQGERLASNTALKKDFNVDVTDVVIVEKPQGTDHANEGSQVAERSKSGSSPQPEVVMRKKRETPMERDIRLNEEREMMLRKERGLSLKPSTPNTDSTPRPTHSHRPSPNNYDSTDAVPYCLQTVNYYIEKEFEAERHRELALQREGKILTVSLPEDTADSDEEETLSPVKKRLHTQKETLLEREIRLEQEREEQYRREKGITSPTSPRVAVEGTDGGTQGATDSVGKATAADTPTAEATKPKYRPQRRSLVLAQQWEQMFK